MTLFFSRIPAFLLLSLTLLAGVTRLAAQPAGVFREVYTGLGGSAVSDLTNAVKFPASPDQTGYLTANFEAPTDTADNYGQRCRALLTAPTTGNYIFWIASDDASTLFLSTDESPVNKVVIASVQAWTASREWTKEANQQSVSKSLVAGQRYYLEALMKEGAGGDNLAVRWQLPSAVIEEPIPAARLTAAWAPAITSQPTNASVAENAPVTFTVRVSNFEPPAFQWQRNSNSIAGATGSSYTIPAVALTNNGDKYRCVISNALGSTNSTNATLTVTTDATPPTLVSAANTGNTTVQVLFSETLQPASATNKNNYAITNSAGPLVVSAAAFGANTKTVLLTTATMDPSAAYTITVDNVRDASSATNVIAAHSQITFTNVVFTFGYIRRDLFNGIAGVSVSDLTSNPAYPNSPTSTDYPGSLGWPAENINDNYGGRMFGYLVPALTGSYTFAIRSDDASQLFLSTDDQPANKVLLTQEPGCCNTFDAHVSSPVNLVAGQRYYIEALMKEGGGGDYLYAAWKTPADPFNWNVIPGDNLGNFLNPPGSTVTLSQPPTNTTAVSGSTATFQVTATGSSTVTTTLTYQWQRNGVDLPGANKASYTTPTVFEADSNTLYRVLVSVPGKTVISGNAILSVLPDTFPPTIANVANIGSSSVQVTFSEPVEAATATNRFNYVFTNGVTVSAAVFGADTKTIFLTTSPLTFGNTYTLFISNVRDRAPAANPIAANSPFTFSVTDYTPQDIGSPAPPGGSIPAGTGYNATGGGAGLGGTGDQFQFAYQQRTGDFDMKVRVQALGVSDVWAAAGLMAREELTSASRFAAAVATPSISGSFFESRDPAGANSIATGNFPANYSETWLRLQRSGNVFTGYASYDGSRWSALGSVTIAMSNKVYFGMATSGHNTNQATLAQFRDLMPATGATTATLSVASEPLGPSTRRTGLVLSEIMYHPAKRADGKDLEFIELFNSTPLDEPLTGFRLSSAIDFSFVPGTVLKAGAFLVVARTPADVMSVYGITNVVGPWVGSLQNNGGTVRLRNERDTILLEANFDNGPPYPIAADGAGHSLVLARPSYGERNAAAWAASAFAAGSPGTGDPAVVDPLRNVVINEFLAHTDPPDVDYIELYNHSAETNDISGCWLSDDGSTNKFQIPPGTILPPRGFAVYYETNLGFALNSGGEDIYFRNAAQTRVIDAIRFEGQANGVATGRYPDGSAGFRELLSKTPGTTNAPLLVRDIVINEIMYAPISALPDDQYVELYNKGAGAVNIGQWRFTAGIDFTLAANTMLPAHGYLVIAKNSARLLTNYPGLTSANTLGNFDGTLSGSGERLALSMPDEVVSTNAGGNLKTNIIYIVVDEVTYGTGGRWPGWANAGGSSLELIDPRADHRLARNWADSDETSKAAWTTIEATGVLDNGPGAGNGSVIDNLQIGLTGAGECLMDNVEVIGPGGTNRIANSTFETGLGNWFPTGTHIASSLETSGGFSAPNALHIRASARGDTGANRIRTPLTATLAAGQTATLRARFRWLRGMPEVVMRLHGNWLEAVGRLNLPANPGTPGAPNSRAVANAGPAIYDVAHGPILPAASQPVVVTARVHDPDSLASVQLKYRVDPSGAFTTVTMLDNGTGSDAVAGDGTFSATIPGQASGALVAFYVQATDNFAPGATTLFPSDAPAHECLVRFGESMPISSFGTYRLWLTQNNINTWVNRLVISNDPIDGTMVYGNWRAIYNMGAHYAGSPYHQGFDSPVGGGCHYSIDLPDDDQLLGTGNFNKLHAPGNGPFDDDSIQREQTAYWMARQIGLPFNYRRYVNVFVNGLRRGTLMEDTQTPGSDVVNALFPDDADGNLHKLQPWFEMNDATTGAMGFDNQSWCTLNRYTTTGGVKKLARYRWNYLTRDAKGTANDYTNVFALIEAANSTPGPLLTTNMQAIADMEEWMRTFAIEHAVGNWDSVGNNNAQNMYGYKPARGKWTLLIWDYNIVLGNSGSDGPTGDDLFKLTGSDPILGTVVNHAPFRRAYWRGYYDIVNGPMISANVDPLLDARYANFVASGITVTSPSSGLKGWIASRRSYIQSQLNSVAAPFAITLNNGGDFSTNGNLVALTGTAPVGVKTITVNGIAYPPAWNTITNFTLLLALGPGANSLTVQGYDSYGRPLAGASDTIAITYTGPDALPQDSLVINEIMYHPLVADAGYVEIYNNSSNVAFNLSGWRLDGVDFTFPPGSIIMPNGFLVVAQALTVFSATYGAGIPLAGVFGGSLDNGGETLRLVKPGVTPDLDQIIDEVRYDDDLPWPVVADGQGPSLQLIDPAKDNYRVANWGATTQAVVATPPQALLVISNAWKYEQTSNLDAVNWKDPGFNDSAWPSGPGLLGVETTVPYPYVDPIRTPLNLGGRITYYFRTHFNFPGSTAGVTLTASNFVDDGAVFYLNGVEVGRLRLPAGVVTFTTLADNAPEGPVVVLNFPTASLVTGDNVLAVEVHQTATTSSDVVFGLSLTANGSTSGGPYTPGAVNSVRSTLPAFPLLWINEVLTLNTNGITDNFGEHEPWIELYNSGTNAISLAGCYLSDNYTNLTQWAFPTNATINAGQFLMVWADGQTNQAGGTNYHTSFPLTNAAGSLALARVSGSLTSVLDYVNFFGLTPNRSYGSFANGQPAQRQLFYFVTPGASNNPAAAPRPVLINEWMADNAGPNGFPDPADGLFQDWFELYNPNTNAVDLSGYFLTDNLGQAQKFRVPNGTSIAPLGFLLVWADNQTNQNGFNADLHANFQLNNGGEQLGLFDPNGLPVSTNTFGPQTQNVSQGRWPDGNTNGVVYFMTNFTPRAPNVLTAGTNTPPVLAFIGNKSVNEGATLTFTNTATDSDVPAQTLTFSLDPGAPAGASISANGGVFTWAPTEAQGPGVFPVTIRVSDNGSPSTNDFETIIITVNEVNSPPVLASIGNKSVNEGATLAFLSTATDSDAPANALSFTLDPGAPAGAGITSAGAFTWTPTEAQGPGVFPVTVRVTDNGSPNLSDTETIFVTVNEVNVAPVLAVIGNKSVVEGALLTFTATATDTDSPPNTLTFTLDPGAPSGAGITSGGVFTWTPTEAQGPTTNNVTIRVTDNGSPALSDFETISIVVTEINSPPTLTPIGNKSATEGVLLTFTNSASDTDIPAQSLAWSLDPGAPAGTSLNATNGVFTWTPDETQGGTTNTLTFRVSDGVTNSSETVTIVVNEVNSAPVLNGIGTQTVNEGSLLSFTAIAMDSDVPAQLLTFSLGSGAPGGAGMTTNGSFTWTPTEAQGPSTNFIVIRVTDNGSPSLSATQTVSIIVNEVNTTPTLNPIADQSINEGALLTFTATASDTDQPAQTLTFSLDGSAPGGAGITAAGGFTWTPSEAQGPSTNFVRVRVTDNGPGSLSATQTVRIVVNEVNSPPVLTAIGNQTIKEGDPLSFTATATDSDLPAQALTFSLDTGAPGGASITPGGHFTWTPTEAQGPSTNALTIRVSDGVTNASQTITITVTESNSAPVLAVVTNQTVNEGDLLTFTVTATDADVPAQLLTFSLDTNAPAGAAITTDGVFTWTPTEAQGPMTTNVIVRVTDNGAPPASATETIQIVVNEVNLAPALDAIPDKTVNEEILLTFAVSATDTDLPAQRLTFTLDTAPAGASLTTNGVFSWKPTEAQGPSTNPVTVRVTDDGSPPLSNTRSFSIVVNEVNTAPVLAAIADQTIVEGSTLTLTATAVDADMPAQHLEFSLVGSVPAGAGITTAGVFTWTPTEAQGPATNIVRVRVADDGSPSLSATQALTIIVTEQNAPPVLLSIGNKSVNEGSVLSFTATATDPDLPAQTLTFSLDNGAPAGAAINATNGVFTWTPDESQGPATNSITIRVTDGAGASAAETIAVIVHELNSPPVLTAIGNKSVNENTALTFAVVATDPDIPLQTLTYSLDAEAPAGAGINPTNGVFTWTPTEAQGGGTNLVTITVTDDGAPPQSVSETIAIVVLEVNSPPTLAPIGNKLVTEFSLLSFTVSATDTDLPAQTLTFTLDSGAPAGAAIDPLTGAFTWYPGETDGPSTNSITIRITDSGVPALSASETILVTVRELNAPPTLAHLEDQTVNEGATLTFTASASDVDLPAQLLIYTLDPGAPVGAGIASYTGVFTWTPTEAQGPSTNSVTVRVTDDGSPALSAFQTITLIVNESNTAPVLTIIPSKFVTAGNMLSFTASATDADLPAQTLTFTLDPGAPAGAGINATNGVFSWMPTLDFASATNQITVRVTDNGSPALSAARSFSIVMVSAPRLTTVVSAAGAVTLTWESFPGKTYRVQYTDDLTTPAWNTLGNDIPAAGNSSTTTDTAPGASQRFYRVLLLD